MDDGIDSYLQALGLTPQGGGATVPSSPVPNQGQAPAVAAPIPSGTANPAGLVAPPAHGGNGIASYLQSLGMQPGAAPVAAPGQPQQQAAPSQSFVDYSPLVQKGGGLSMFSPQHAMSMMGGGGGGGGGMMGGKGGGGGGGMDMASIAMLFL